MNVGWTQSFAYDGLNRLTSAARSDSAYNHTHNYDSFGNLLVQDNLKPHDEHMDMHKKNGDFKRWGSRRKQAQK